MNHDIYRSMIPPYLSKSALTAEGSDIGGLERRLKEVVLGFSSELACLPDELLFLPVTAGRWCPLEIAEHLHLSNQLLAHAVAAVSGGRDALVLPRGVFTSEGTMVAHESSVPKSVPRLGEVTDALSAGADELVARV